MKKLDLTVKDGMIELTIGQFMIAVWFLGIGFEKPSKSSNLTNNLDIQLINLEKHEDSTGLFWWFHPLIEWYKL